MASRSTASSPTIAPTGTLVNGELWLRVPYAWNKRGAGDDSKAAVADNKDEPVLSCATPGLTWSRLRTQMEWYKPVRFGAPNRRPELVRYWRCVDGPRHVAVPLGAAVYHGFRALERRTTWGQPFGPPVAEGPPVAVELRPYQRVACERIWAFLAKHATELGAAAGTLVMPCGSGKTVTSARAAVRMRRRVAHLVPLTDIFDETVSTYRRFTTARVGTVQRKKWDVAARDGPDVVVMMIPTLMRSIKEHGLEATQRRLNSTSFGMVVIDEAHGIAAPETRGVLQLFQARLRLCLTATPERDDGMPTAPLLGPVVCRVDSDRPLMTSFIQLKKPTPAIVAENNPQTDNVAFDKLCAQVAEHTALCDVLVDLVDRLVQADRTVGVFMPRADAFLPHLVTAVAQKLRARAATTEGRRRLWRVNPDATEARDAFEDTGAGTRDGRIRSPLVAAKYADLTKERREAVRAAVEGMGWDPDLDVLLEKSGSRSKKAQELRARILRARVLMGTVDMFGTGTNAPWIDTLVVLACRRGEALNTQTNGRAAREWYKGKAPWVLNVSVDVKNAYTFHSIQNDVRLLCKKTENWRSRTTTLDMTDPDLEAARTSLWNTLWHDHYKPFEAWVHASNFRGFEVIEPAVEDQDANTVLERHLEPLSTAADDDADDNGGGTLLDFLCPPTTSAATTTCSSTEQKGASIAVPGSRAPAQAKKRRTTTAAVVLDDLLNPPVGS